MYEILVTEPEYLDSEAEKVLERAGHVTAMRLSRRALERAIPKFDAIFVRIETTIDSELLKKAKKLKIIGSVTTGLDHIDVAAAKKLGIKIISMHGTHTIATAEHTMTLMLALCRKMPWAYDNVRRGRWERHRFIGTQLNGKILGLVGLGRVGSQLAEYAKAFGMRVIAYDPYVKSNDVKLVSNLDKLLRESDIISIHAMLTKETKGMVGSRQFRELKKGAFLVNTARAEIVDRRALLHALRSGTLAGAAFDVFENEPIKSAEEPMIKYAQEHDNLILTPHIGASTREAVRAGSVEIAEGVEKALKQF